MNEEMTDLELDELINGEFELINDDYGNGVSEIKMPYHPDPNREYQPRDYQAEFWDMFNKYTEEDAEIGYCAKDQIGDLKRDDTGMLMKEKFKRIVFIWHRRAGKDFDTWQRFLCYAAVDPGIYYYMLPTASQAKKVIFDGMSNEADRFIDFLPKELYKNGVGWNKSEMKVELTNGSIIQILGSDNYDRIVGTNPKGIVFSEYALCNPAAWSYMRPILKMNGGFAWFISTPRGRNHLYNLVEIAQRPSNIKNWSISIKTIYDTGLMDEEGYQQELNEGMEESKAQQEYLCDFNAPVKGSYYSEQIIKVHKEGRMTVFNFNPALAVKCAFDIGVNDKTSIVFWQQTKEGFDIIAYYENDSQGLEYYVRQLTKFEAKNDIVISHVYFPHDMAVKEFGGGKKRIQVARAAMPDKTCKVLERSPVAEGIDCVRRVLRHCRFLDKKIIDGKQNVAFLLNALSSYHKQYDEKKMEYLNNPVHDWSSHPADAFRYFAVIADKELSKMEKKAGARKTAMRKDSVI